MYSCKCGATGSWREGVCLLSLAAGTAVSGMSTRHHARRSSRRTAVVRILFLYYTGLGRQPHRVIIQFFDHRICVLYLCGTKESAVCADCLRWAVCKSTAVNVSCLCFRLITFYIRPTFCVFRSCFDHIFIHITSHDEAASACSAHHTCAHAREGESRSQFTIHAILPRKPAHSKHIGIPTLLSHRVYTTSPWLTPHVALVPVA